MHQLFLNQKLLEELSELLEPVSLIRGGVLYPNVDVSLQSDPEAASPHIPWNPSLLTNRITLVDVLHFVTFTPKIS